MKKIKSDYRNSEQDIKPDYRNLEQDTKENTDYRRVVFTGKKLQMVLMNLKPLEDIHMEVHIDHDQFIRIESGSGLAIINNQKYDLKDGFSIIIPAGCRHKIENTSNIENLKLYTIYAPPEQPDGLIQHDKPNVVIEGGYKKPIQYYKLKNSDFLN
jgi:mannose-6-phosphate isomerase-like protein (cupin superfamily)